MKTILSSFLLACALLQAAQPPAEEQSATLKKKVEGVDEKVLGVADEYVLEIVFGRQVPKSSISRSAFRIQDKDNDAVVPIKRMRRLRSETLVAGVTNIRALEIEADYNPARPYVVWISLSNEVPYSIEVKLEKPTDEETKAKEEAAAKARKPSFNYHYRFLSVDLNPFTADDDSAFGLKYDVRFLVKRAYPWDGVLNFELQTHGEFSITPQEDSATSVQNSINGGLTASYLYNVPMTLALPRESRTYLYPLGFRVAPAEFEANKSFSDVNYSFKALVGGAVPFADYPALIWNQIFGLQVPFFAPTLYTGFAALSEIKDDGSDTLAKLGHTRWDTEFLYYLPLHSRVDFKFTWNWYVGLEKGFSKDNYEAGIVVYMDDKRTHGFTLSRQKGALPPDFIQTESWRIGYTAKF